MFGQEVLDYIEEIQSLSIKVEVADIKTERETDPGRRRKANEERSQITTPFHKNFGQLEDIFRKYLDADPTKEEIDS